VAFVSHQRVQSQDSISGQGAQQTWIFIIKGNPAPTSAGGDDADNQYAVRNYINAQIGGNIPYAIANGTLLGLTLFQISYKHLGVPGCWDVSITYHDATANANVGSSRFSFSIGGISQHITNSYMVQSSGYDNTLLKAVPSTGTSIGVSGEGVKQSLGRRRREKPQRFAQFG
jgi:hypothetical protein